MPWRGHGGRRLCQRVVPLSVGPPLAVAKGFEGGCPHAASRAEAVGAEQQFLWLQAALGTRLVNKGRGFVLFPSPGGPGGLASHHAKLQGLHGASSHCPPHCLPMRVMHPSSVGLGCSQRG